MADKTQRIAEIRKTLQAGAMSVMTDGTIVTFGFDQFRDHYKDKKIDK